MKKTIGYLYDDYKVTLLQIILLKASAYVKRRDGQTKWTFFLIEDEDLLKKILCYLG